MAEYLEKSAVIKAIHNEIYSGGKWSGGWYEKSEEQAEKDFTKRINAITPEKVIDISIIEKMHNAVDNAEPDTYIENPLFYSYALTKKHVNEIIDKAVKEIRNDR